MCTVQFLWQWNVKATSICGWSKMNRKHGHKYKHGLHKDALHQWWWEAQIKGHQKVRKMKNREYMLKRSNCSYFFSFYFMSAVAFFLVWIFFFILCLHWKCFTEKFHWEFTIKFVWKLIYVPKMFNFYAMVFARIFLDRNEFLAFTFFMLTFLPLFTQK